MKPLIVLIDGGWLKYSSRTVCKKRLGVIENGEDPDGCIQLANDARTASMLYDVMVQTLRGRMTTIEQTLQAPMHILVCMDKGDSWRSNIPRTIIPGEEHQASGLAYKAGRHSDDPASLAAMYKLNRWYEDALEQASTYSGIQLVASPSVEADDFMVCMSNYYAQHGYNCCIVSEDADITQAVHKFDNGGHVVVFRPRHDDQPYVVSPASLEAINTKPTIFDSLDTFDMSLKRLQNPKVVASQYLLFWKVLKGDASDAITPVMVRKSASGRNMGLRQKDFDKLTEMLASKHALSYMPREALWEDIDDILALEHQLVFKQDFASLPTEWQNFYRAKYVENLQMVCIDEVIMPDLWRSIQDYAANLQLHTVNYNIPTNDVLSRLGI